MSFFPRLIRDQKAGVTRGIASICSAHPLVLKAAMEQAREDELPLLVESTANQVNQFGGYTGMRPADFRTLVLEIAALAGFPADRVILGGDHLGPYPWRTDSAETAMQKACDLVSECVRAGYAKLHLDASMPLGGDAADPAAGLDGKLAAQREARLAQASEAVSPGSAPVYVIGTDVPTPGGTEAGEERIHVTTVAELTATVESCREAFYNLGLRQAWERVAAVVVQPGIEFGDQVVHPYDRQKARPLCEAAQKFPGMVLEGHSTDYQLPESLKLMVEDGIAILKVGPALTFAVREALFALERIERELHAGAPEEKLSRLAETMEQAMLLDPSHWSGYYRGGEHEQRLARRYSLSDRCRYYWKVPEVEAAVKKLIANLAQSPIPLPLLSQYLPLQHRLARRGSIANSPAALIDAAVRMVLDGYARAVIPSWKPSRFSLS